MIPMNNHLFQLMNVMQSGGNSTALLRQMAGQNPQVRQAMQMMRGKSPAELQQMAQNMAKERNIDLNQLLQQFGMANPSKR